MDKNNEIIEQLQACAKAISDICNQTAYKGCLIDAETHVLSAISHIERHAQNEKARGRQ